MNINPEPEHFLERARTAVRNRRRHDWHLSLLPAAIDFGVPKSCLRVCKVLCEQQRDWHPVVYASTDHLAAELAMEKRNCKRAIRRLVGEGLLQIVVGGGRQAPPHGDEGRANTYILGPAVSPYVEAAIKGVKNDTLRGRERVSEMTPLADVVELNNRVKTDTPPLRGTSYPSGGSGERTAALTGGPTPLKSSPATVSPSRFRELIGRLNPANHGLGMAR